MERHFIAFWNVENLFDVEDSSTRPAWLQDELSSELRGWDQAILERKVSQLARIIRQLNNGQGFDVLGLCEIENQRVVDLLVGNITVPGRNYSVRHHDTSDLRGIDVAFVYDSDKLTAEEEFFHVVLKRNATRDIYQVNFETTAGNPLILIGNHWPSRSGGELPTQPYRMTAAETLSYWHKRIQEIRGKDIAILVMGDFNDEPFNRSVTDYALAGRSKAKVLGGASPRFLNLMWPALGTGVGTHYYNNFPNVLDQFWVSKGIVTGTGRFTVEENSVRIERFREMIASEMNHQIKHPRPIRFGRPSNSTLDENGFSDHYPVSMVLLES